MANAIEAAREIADATGVALPTVENIARRLGETGWLPRGGRGRHAAQLGPQDIATLLIGTMVVAGDAIETPASRVQTAVERIGKLNSGGEPTIDIYDDEDGVLATTPAGTFVTTVATLISSPAFRAGIRVLAIGLQFGGGTVCGWIEIKTAGGGKRLNFGLVSDVTTAGMVREVRVGVDVLDRMSDLFDQQDERQDELPLTATKVSAA